LSQEILWYRALGVMTGTRPQVFGLMLTFYLAGIALSALKVKKLSEDGGDLRAHVRKSLFTLLAASFVALPFTAWTAFFAGQGAGLLVGFLAAGMLAYLAGGVFPALCQATDRMTPVYACNIVGAALGPLVTGFFLLDVLTLGQASVLIAAAVALPLILLQGIQPRMLAVLAFGLACYPLLYRHIPEKLLRASEPFRHVVQNRGGIITVLRDTSGGDIVLGNGAYDGRINIDPVLDSNMITRVYMMAAFHPRPERILEIGLSTGAWAAAALQYTPLEELVSVEINKGYPALIAQYPEVAGLLEHPKMRRAVDDGRRWMKRNPSEKFDVILMNTSIHWRNNSTNVLSREFLELCKAHLKPGGIVYYNTTGSAETVYTAAQVFKHVAVFNKMVAAGEAPFAMTRGQKQANLARFRPALNAGVRERLAAFPIKDLGEDLRAQSDLHAVTDDNMWPEFKSGGQRFLPETSWRASW
jgi:spermidine synthase